MSNDQVQVHIGETMEDVGASVPAPSGMGAVRQNPDYAGWTFGVITLGPGPWRVERDRVASDK